MKTKFHNPQLDIDFSKILSMLELVNTNEIKGLNWCFFINQKSDISEYPDEDWVMEHFREGKIPFTFGEIEIRATNELYKDLLLLKYEYKNQKYYYDDLDVLLNLNDMFDRLTYIAKNSIPKLNQPYYYNLSPNSNLIINSDGILEVARTTWLHGGIIQKITELSLEFFVNLWDDIDSIEREVWNLIDEQEKKQ